MGLYREITEGLAEREREDREKQRTAEGARALVQAIKAFHLRCKINEALRTANMYRRLALIR
jgi:hypothetical protein